MQTLAGPEVRRMLEALMDAWMQASEREYDLNLACERPEGSSVQLTALSVYRRGTPVALLRMYHDFDSAETRYEGEVLDERNYQGLRRKYA